MQCCICKEKPATVYLTQIVGDKELKLDLCEECAKAKGLNETGFAIADLMLGLGASQEIEAAAAGVELKCPRCGFTQADFKKSGRLGCPDCYRTFAEGLAGLLKSMHKGTRHMGKAPEALRQTRENVDRLKNLQKKLAKAIEDENYESAAALRDEIRILGGIAAKSR
jgi:protein arginine kinase activator